MGIVIGNKITKQEALQVVFEDFWLEATQREGGGGGEETIDHLGPTCC